MTSKEYRRLWEANKNKTSNKRCLDCDVLLNHRNKSLRCYSCGKKGDLNPMKNLITRRKVSISNKGSIPWNKGKRFGPMSKERKRQNSEIMKEIWKTRVNPMSNPTVRAKCSQTRKERIRQGLIVMSERVKEQARQRMKKNRQDEEFNKKMFASFKRQTTLPHRTVKRYLTEHGYNDFISNYPILVGKTWGSVDEADEKLKIAIYVDGEYWHNYPEGRQWDKTCTTFLTNRNWQVIRIWAKQINENSLGRLLPFIQLPK